MADIITQEGPDGFSKEILGAKGISRAKASFETYKFYALTGASNRSSHSKPYNCDPLLFRGFIYKEGDSYYRVLKTPIPSQYSYRKMNEIEVREYVSKELVLNSQDAIKRAYEFTGSVTYTTPGRLSLRKDLEKIFNDLEAYNNFIKVQAPFDNTIVNDDTIR